VDPEISVQKKGNSLTKRSPRAQNKTAGPECFRSRRLSLLLPRAMSACLCLNDARRDEEDQLLVGGADILPLEQIAQIRDISQQRHLRNVD
jgi:hypothetical protein